MGDLNDSKDKDGDVVSDAIKDWIDKNVTEDVISKCNDKLYSALESIFTAPYKIVLPLVKVSMRKEFKHKIITTWGIISGSILTGSIILSLLDSNFKVTAWVLGVLFSTPLVLFMYKKNISISVKGSIAERIKADLAKLNTIVEVNENGIISSDCDLISSSNGEEDNDIDFDFDDEEDLVLEENSPSIEGMDTDSMEELLGNSGKANSYKQDITELNRINDEDLSDKINALIAEDDEEDYDVDLDFDDEDDNYDYTAKKLVSRSEIQSRSDR